MMPDKAACSSDIGYLSLAQVLDLVPVGRSTLYAWIASGIFPPPDKLGPRRVGWPIYRIKAWLRARETAR